MTGWLIGLWLVRDSLGLEADSRAGAWAILAGVAVLSWWGMIIYHWMQETFASLFRRKPAEKVVPTPKLTYSHKRDELRSAALHVGYDAETAYVLAIASEPFIDNAICSAEFCARVERVRNSYVASLSGTPPERVLHPAIKALRQYAAIADQHDELMYKDAFERAVKRADRKINGHTQRRQDAPVIQSFADLRRAMPLK